MSLQLPLRCGLLIASCAVAFSISTAARAANREESPSTSGNEWVERPLALHSLLSIPAGPTGVVGIELDYSPTKNLGFTAGTGQSVSLVTGDWAARYALGARYRFPLAAGFALGSGFTFSTGKWLETNWSSTTTSDSPAAERFQLDQAVWLGGQASIEFRDGPLSFKGLIGLEVLANRSSGKCYDTSSVTPGGTLTSCSHVHDAVLPQDVFFSPFGFAIGYAF